MARTYRRRRCISWSVPPRLRCSIIWNSVVLNQPIVDKCDAIGCRTSPARSVRKWFAAGSAATAHPLRVAWTPCQTARLESNPCGPVPRHGLRRSKDEPPASQPRVRAGPCPRPKQVRSARTAQGGGDLQVPHQSPATVPPPVDWSTACERWSWWPSPASCDASSWGGGQPRRPASSRSPDWHPSHRTRNLGGEVTSYHRLPLNAAPSSSLRTPVGLPTRTALLDTWSGSWSSDGGANAAEAGRWPQCGP